MITQEDVRKSKWIVLHTNVMTRDRRPTSRHEHLKYSCYKYMKSSISSNYIHFYRVLCAMARATATDESCWYKKLHNGTNTATLYLHLAWDQLKHFPYNHVIFPLCHAAVTLSRFHGYKYPKQIPQVLALYLNDFLHCLHKAHLFGHYNLLAAHVGTPCNH